MILRRRIRARWCGVSTGVVRSRLPVTRLLLLILLRIARSRALRIHSNGNGLLGRHLSRIYAHLWGGRSAAVAVALVQLNLVLGLHTGAHCAPDDIRGATQQVRKSLNLLAAS